MKKPTLLFVLKCIAIICLITFTDVERFTIVPANIPHAKGSPPATRVAPTVTGAPDPVANNLQFTGF